MADLSELESLITTFTDGLSDAANSLSTGLNNAASSINDGLDDFHPELTLSTDKVTIDFENEKFLLILAIVFLVYMVLAMLYYLTGCCLNIKHMRHMNKESRREGNNQDSRV